MKWFRRTLWAALACAAALLIVRTFFFRVYYIDGPSMEPALHGAATGGDYVLVAYGRPAVIERYDLLVILREDEKEPLVKRALGLPKEDIVLRNGDVWIDDKILRNESGMPVPVLVFDDDLHDLTRDFRLTDAWTQVGKGWKVDATSIDRGAMAGCAYMGLGLQDHYLDPAGVRVGGRDQVADAMLECSVEVTDPGFVVHLGLIEQGDVFEILIETDNLPRAVVTLRRNAPMGEEAVLAQGEVTWLPGEHELRFANVNDRQTFEFDGQLILSSEHSGDQSFAANMSGAGVHPPNSRVFLGGHSGIGVFSGIRVLRDLHYTPRGDYAVGDTLNLGPDEIFLLGDNSRESRDGRDWGRTPLSEVIGTPLGVVWPPSRIRRFKKNGEL